MSDPAGEDAKTLYLDPWTGVSGDMFLSALLDIDGEQERLAGVLRTTVSALGLDEGLVEVAKVVEKGVACTRLTVRADGTAPLRHLADMEGMIAAAGLPDRVETRSRAALRRLAEVEASIHGCSVEEIHFHEVGAVDTLVDVVGTFALIEALRVRRVVVGPIPVGGGTVEIAHGLMGVPAPATSRLLEGYPIVGGPVMRELTTPTGAILVGTLGAEPGPLPAMIVDAVGYGAGSMSLECGPNVLRAVIGREAPAATAAAARAATDPAAAPEAQADAAGAGGHDEVVELQTNLDDVSLEVVAHAAGLLREAGALDVWTTSGAGKKGRVAVVLHVLALAAEEERLVDIVFAQTGTLGVRRAALSRWVAERGSVTVQVAGRDLSVKWGRWKGRLTSLAPEYDEAAALADACGLPLPEVMRVAAEAAAAALEERA